MNPTLTAVADLRCEYLTNPIGIDELSPRLSWKMQAENRRGAQQTAYQITAASSIENLKQPDALLWDTGKVHSDQSTQVVYAGPALRSTERIYWQVRLWDENDAISESEIAFFETGLLETSDWKGEWIGAHLVGGPRTPIPSPFLRREIRCDSDIHSARLYVTALGLYEFHINGQKIGNDVLTPGWTDYKTRLSYQTYDVTDLLKAGSNVAGAILGDGWYAGHIGWEHRQRYGDRPKLLAQLHIKLANGDTKIVTTDSDWQYQFGPILESDLLMGEAYDARLELGDWCLPGYDATGWHGAAVFPAYAGALVAGKGQPVRSVAEITPVGEPNTFKQWPRSRAIYDLGQNMVGKVRLRLQNTKPGETITIRYAEVLDKYNAGGLYTENLRGARCTDYYTCKGGAEETYESRFTFHGFRYVEVGGSSASLTQDAVTGIVLMSDTPFHGEFNCADPLVNQLQKNIQWGQRGNFLEVPTDCPQRDERLGWTGDAQVFIRTACFNADVAPFFTKWIQDLRDAQDTGQGSYPSVVPEIGMNKDGGPAWADAGVICPWTLYLCFGDRRILERHYESMQRFVQWQADTARDGIRCYDGYSGFHGYGDWLALDGSGMTEGGTPKELIGTAFHAYSANLLSEIALVLGKPEDAARYREIFERVRAAFQRRFITGDGLLAPGTQTAYVLALYFDLMPDPLRQNAGEALVRDIKKRGMHLSTGFVGTSYLPHLLTDLGHTEIAFNLLFQKTWPSYLYAVTQGATTIWERWDGWTQEKGFQDKGMNSYNHYAYGAVGAWLYQRVAGIDIDPAQPGYKHIIYRPLIGDSRMPQASAHIETPYGRAESSWSVGADGQFDWQIKVPANTQATVHLPAREADTITESGTPIADAVGVLALRREKNELVLSVDSGRYAFRVAPAVTSTPMGSIQ